MQTEIAQGEIQIWVTDIGDWLSEKKEYLRMLFNEDELMRLDRYKISSKRDQFLCSRGLLKLVLSGYLDEDPAEVNLLTSPAGKPYLPNLSLNFNISHSGDLLILGFGHFNHIGVDVQEVYPISNLDKMIEKSFNDEEKTYLKSLEPDHQISQFFSLWTAKEAYLKALGEGFQISPQSYSILPETETRGSFHHSGPNNPKSNQDWTIRKLDLRPGYMGAAAVDGNLREMVILPLKPSI